MKVFNIDQATKLGLSKYREPYPAAQISAEVEKHANLSVLLDVGAYSIVITYSLRNKADPYVLFRATITKHTGEIKVLEAAPSPPLNSIDHLDLEPRANLRELPNDSR